MIQSEPETPPPSGPWHGRSRRIMIVALGCAALAIVLIVWLRNTTPSEASGCVPQPLAAKAIDAAAQGALAALNPTATGRGYADLKFEDGVGNPHTLKEFEGKTLLVNFWASWCLPCRAEMPALDALAKKLNGPNFMVLPINLDIGASGLAKAKAFLAKIHVPNLPIYADPTFKAFDRLKSEAVSLGLPTSLLLDRKACEIAVLQGPAKWDSADGVRVIDALEKLKG